jgi:geranylgeranyl reductase family protein
VVSASSAFDADVLIAGAGPAGAAAALRLARAGWRVVLCDRSRFPRDKACGDGLIADSIAALNRLGLDRAVSDAAYRTSGLLTISPGGTEVRFTSAFWVLPRRVLDDVIVRAALDAGARFEDVIVESPLVEGGRVAGFRGRRPGSEAPVTLRAPLTMLATGGAAGVLRRFDPNARGDASGVAIRAYTRASATVTDLVISLERDLLPGYAWAFPAPDGLLNVGVGALRGRGLGAGARNLRQRLDRLLAGEGRLGKMLGRQEAVTAYQGAPLRTGLSGAAFGRPGLVVIGEAAGTTYSLTGEGIGKAMESGLLAADLAVEAGQDACAMIGARYAETMRSRYAARFRTYDAAQRWVAFPFISDYVARRANRSAWVHERLTRVITEQALPSHVFSARTLWRLVTHD